MVGKTPLYGPDEMPRLVLGLICFLFWAGCAWISLRQQQKLWICAAFCPLLFVLLYPAALPLAVVNSKLPESFLTTHQDELGTSRYLLSNDVGLGVTLGWQFKRSDIVLVGADGELTYGLKKSGRRRPTYSDRGFCVLAGPSAQTGPGGTVSQTG